jgi:hypothetical protein
MNASSLRSLPSHITRHLFIITSNRQGKTAFNAMNISFAKYRKEEIVGHKIAEKIYWAIEEHEAVGRKKIIPLRRLQYT